MLVVLLFTESPGRLLLVDDFVKTFYFCAAAL